MISKVLPLLVCLTLAGCGASAEKKEAIQAVLSQRLAAKALFGNPANPQQFQTNSVAFLGALKAIDVSRCPSDFRAAWSDYVAIMERSIGRFSALVTSKSPVASGGNVSTPPSTTLIATSPAPPSLLRPSPPTNRAEIVADLERRIALFQREVDIAWEDLAEKAKRHGVAPQR